LLRSKRFDAPKASGGSIIKALRARNNVIIRFSQNYLHANVNMLFVARVGHRNLVQQLLPILGEGSNIIVISFSGSAQ